MERQSSPPNLTGADDEVPFTPHRTARDADDPGLCGHRRMTMLIADPEVIIAQTIDLDSVNTRYFEAGSGEPMVFWHGDSLPGSANANTWDLNLGPLSREFHV